MKNCNQCGKCCIGYGDGGLTATTREIAAWEALQPEIAQYVINGKIWMDPETETQLSRCPWLQETSQENKYQCKIYEHRPEDCRHYPVTIAQMLNDDCEMIEIKDLERPRQSQRKLDRIMADSRPPLLP